MWTMTTDGFLSAVQHNTDPDLLVVRGRVKADVRALAQYAVVAAHEPTDPDAVILTYPLSDYPWRVILPKDIYAAYVTTQIMAIDYGNFKTAVAQTQPHHARAYANVWTDLLALERTDVEADPSHQSPYAWAGTGFQGLNALDGWDDDWDREDTYTHSSSDAEQPPALAGWTPPVRHDAMADDSSTRYGDPF